MIAIIAILLFGIFLCLSAIHVYWAFSGTWGLTAAIPTKDDNSTKLFHPGKATTWVVALGLLGSGLFILTKTLFPAFEFPEFLDKYGLWILSGIFIFRAIGDFYYIGFFKKITHTSFGQNDTRFYSPLCLLMGILTFVLAL